MGFKSCREISSGKKDELLNGWKTQLWNGNLACLKEKVSHWKISNAILLKDSANND
ncbi:MAG: hypothetical protein HON76_03815 [Candidatus Scalindua sp.]|jgi:hypothetical protein|nr:hypothetical protein [Candidatus Scalindua sp.]MBT6561636.1 hypothetical protein [Candidatus Scalindua sp.]